MNGLVEIARNRGVKLSYCISPIAALILCIGSKGEWDVGIRAGGLEDAGSLQGKGAEGVRHVLSPERPYPTKHSLRATSRPPNPRPRP